MEIVNYSNFQLDESVYGKNELVTVLDKTGGFLYENIYDIEPPIYNKNFTVRLYLMFGIKNQKLKNALISELDIAVLTKKKLKNLSTGELLKVLIVKTILSEAQTVILEGIDAYLNHHDLEHLLKTIKAHLKEADKTVIFETNKPEHLLFGTKYIVASDSSIIYNGHDFKKLPIDIETVEFAKLANKKGAKLDYYKEVNDLLKAIYRSVQ